MISMHARVDTSGILASTLATSTADMSEAHLMQVPNVPRRVRCMLRRVRDRAVTSKLQPPALHDNSDVATDACSQRPKLNSPRSVDPTTKGK